MPQTVSLNVGLFDTDTLTTKSREVGKNNPPKLPDGLNSKRRWLQCVVKNETQFAFKYKSTYWSSGRYWIAAESVESFTQMVFSCCNKDGSFLTGVSGGIAFEADLDAQTTFDVAIGFTNPQFGSFKAGIVESSSAETGYDNASGDGNTANSKNNYKGSAQLGNPSPIRFYLSATAGQEPMFVIRQEVL